MLVLAVGGWVFGIEPRWLQTSQHEIHSAKLDRPIRLAIIADLQTDRIGNHERRALEAVVAAKPDLVLLAGHTHAGPARLPLIGPLLTFSRIPRAWAAGRTDFDDGRTLVVSRGIGMERGNAPRMRFLCRPEVVLIDLLPAS